MHCFLFSAATGSWSHALGLILRCVVSALWAHSAGGLGARAMSFCCRAVGAGAAAVLLHRYAPGAPGLYDPIVILILAHPTPSLTPSVGLTAASVHDPCPTLLTEPCPMLSHRALPHAASRGPCTTPTMTTRPYPPYPHQSQHSYRMGHNHDHNDRFLSGTACYATPFGPPLMRALSLDWGSYHTAHRARMGGDMHNWRMF